MPLLEVTRDWTRSSAVRSQCLTGSAKSQPPRLDSNSKFGHMRKEVYCARNIELACWSWKEFFQLLVYEIQQRNRIILLRPDCLAASVCGTCSILFVRYCHPERRFKRRPFGLNIRKIPVRISTEYYFEFETHGIATSYWLDDGGVEVRVPVGSSRPALGSTKPHPMGTGGSFPGCKVAGAWRWPLTSN
jgi:hypothetical protein